MTECNSSYGFSSSCRLPAGHTGDHTNGVIRWDETKAAASQRRIAELLGEGTD